MFSRYVTYVWWRGNLEITTCVLFIFVKVTRRNLHTRLITRFVTRGWYESQYFIRIGLFGTLPFITSLLSLILWMDFAGTFLLVGWSRIHLQKSNYYLGRYRSRRIFWPLINFICELYQNQQNLFRVLVTF